MFSLSKETISSFAVSKCFSDLGKVSPHSIDFSPDGAHVAFGSEDSSVNIFSVENAQPKRRLHCKARGVGLVRYTHHPQDLLLTSRNVNKDDAIQYLSVKENRYIRLFEGHQDLVTGLEMCPIDDSFLSTSLDRSVRFWDLKASQCQAKLPVSGHPLACFDPQGVVFAVASAANQIRLFDRRNSSAGPFATFHLDDTSASLCHLSFSPDGKMLLLAARQGLVALMDSFTGLLTHTYRPSNAALDADVEARFSPDGKFVCAGSIDGSIAVWNHDSTSVVHTLQSNSGAVGALRWHPRRALLVAGANQLSFLTSRQVTTPSLTLPTTSAAASPTASTPANPSSTDLSSAHSLSASLASLASSLQLPLPTPPPPQKQQSLSQPTFFPPAASAMDVTPSSAPSLSQSAMISASGIAGTATSSSSSTGGSLLDGLSTDKLLQSLNAISAALGGSQSSLTASSSAPAAVATSASAPRAPAGYPNPGQHLPSYNYPMPPPPPQGYAASAYGSLPPYLSSFPLPPPPPAFAGYPPYDHGRVPPPVSPPLAHNQPLSAHGYAPASHHQQHNSQQSQHSNQHSSSSSRWSARK